MALALKRKAMADRRDTPITLALREVLGTVLSEDVTERILDEALRFWAEETIPEEEEKLKLFVQGPLRGVLERQVGTDDADLVLADLAIILKAALVRHTVAPSPSGIRRKQSKATVPVRMSAFVKSDAHATIPAPAPGLLMISVISNNREMPAKLAGRLEGVASVSVVADPFAMLDGIEVSSAFRPILVLDCNNPCSGLSTAAAIALELSNRLTVVLWGTYEEVNAALRGLPALPSTWIRCGNATSDVLADLCLSIYA